MFINVSRHVQWLLKKPRNRQKNTLMETTISHLQVGSSKGHVISQLTAYIGAAASMRYARPNELPSYPSTGLPHREERGQDATTAATLGWQNQKPVEIYRPAPSSSAATAANLGWKSKAPEHWKPEQSMNGARAAVLASQRDKGKASVPPPPPSPKQPASTQKQRPDTSSWGNSAANIAVANSKRPKTANPQPTVTQAIKEKQRPKSSGWGNSAANIAVANSKRPETPPSQSTLRKDAINRHGSMRAATGAMTTPVQRPSSAPGSRPSYPDAANARANALRAAAHADNASKRPKPAGGATPAVSMPRGKFTSHPTTDAQVDEKTKQDQMQASAVAMAKLMYKNMQKTEQDPTSKAGASAATGRHGRSLSLSSAESNQPPPMRFNNIHDQATRLAAERVAAMHDEEAEARDLRAYYGLQPPPQPQRRFSVGKLFKKKPDSDDELSDDEGSRRIRQQMSLFQSRLSQVDNRKQMSDREALMAAAQRKVQKDLADIDQQVYQKTGKVTPQMQADWDAKARAAAEAESQRRMEHFGQVDIGGGQYMEQEDLNAIAQRNIEPHMIAADNQAQQMILERDLKKQKKLDKKEFKADQKAMKKMDKAEAARQVERNKFQAKETEMVKKQIVGTP